MYATKVSDRVYLLDTYALGVRGIVGAYLIKGPKPTLVDCGYATSYRNVLAGLVEAGVSPSEVRYIVPTHVHLDHAGAAGHLLKEMPQAEVVAQEKAVPHLADPSRLIESATRVFGAQVMELYGRPIPIAAERLTPVGDEGRLDIGGIELRMIHTPGHAPHQLSAFIEGEKALITADAVGIVYPGLNAMIPTTPPPSFDPATLVRSVRTLGQMGARKLLMPHYGARDDVQQVCDDTMSMVPQWVAEVKKLVGMKQGLDAISESMAKRVSSEAGVEDLSIPARVSIRTSVMGIIHYLEKNP